MNDGRKGWGNPCSDRSPSVEGSISFSVCLVAPSGIPVACISCVCVSLLRVSSIFVCLSNWFVGKLCCVVPCNLECYNYALACIGSVGICRSIGGNTHLWVGMSFRAYSRCHSKTWAQTENRVAFMGWVWVDMLCCVGSCDNSADVFWC